MIEFGNTLRMAREAKGMTTSEIAGRTHMLVQQVEALENEDFSRIAAPIYGRGFVRLYCEAVGIDPRPLIEEFMEIYNGNRDLPVKRREKPRPAPPPPPPPPPELALSAGEPPAGTVPAGPAPEPLPPDAEPAQDEFPDASSAEVPAHDAAAGDAFAVRTPDAGSHGGFELEPETAAPMPKEFRRFNPYVAPSRDEPPAKRWRMPDVPPYVWRFAILAAVGLIAIWLLFAGIRAIYRASMSSPANEAAQAETQPAEPAKEAKERPAPAPAEHAPGKPAATGRTQRVPLDIPSLYLD